MKNRKMTMIKKKTKALFLDGAYQGEYDWEGGLPLCKGEILTVKCKDKSIKYQLLKKEIIFHAKGKEPNAEITYTFQLC